MTAVRYLIITALLLFILLLASCSLPTRVRYTYDVTYGSLGAGPGDNVNLIALKQGAVSSSITTALLKAFQDQNLSFLNIGTNLLEQEKSYLTETIELTPEQITTYNEANKAKSNFLLHPGPNYRIHFQVQYKMMESTMKLTLSIAVILEQEGTGANTWHKYMKDYNSAYFIAPIKNRFVKYI